MADIFMKPAFNPPFLNQGVIQDRRSRPTSFVSTLRFGGRRKGSALDAISTLLHLENGASELNPLMEQIIQSGFESFFIIKSLGIGLIACFLASHQNFKISFYGMHVSATIYIVLSAYHLACSFLF